MVKSFSPGITAHKPTHILAPLHEIPPTGFAQLLIHLQHTDKAYVDAAAAAMGLSQQLFMRTLLVGAAKKLCDELNVKIK